MKTESLPISPNGNTILTATDLISGTITGHGSTYTLGKFTGMAKGIYLVLFKARIVKSDSSVTTNGCLTLLNTTCYLDHDWDGNVPGGINITYLLEINSDNYTWQPTASFYGYSTSSFNIAGTASLQAIKLS